MSRLWKPRLLHCMPPSQRSNVPKDESGEDLRLEIELLRVETGLPALLPGLARSQPPILPWLPPLEVELTEDPEPVLAQDASSCSPDPEAGDLSPADPALSITVSPGLDQIPSTINSLSPRSNRNIR